MSRLTSVLAALCLLAVQGRADAQEPPTSDPSTPIEAEPPASVGSPANADPASPSSLPPGHPSPSGASAQPPLAPGPAQRSLAAVLRPPSLASAEPSESLAAGTIRVTVVDASGTPIPAAAVDVGMLAQGDRERHNGETDSDGLATFTGLATGSGQAYRVNVPHAGAKYSSAPFQLPDDRGYDVRVTRLPVTRDDRFVFFHVFRVVVEQRGERIHVIHQAELTNAGGETYVFPASGERVALPEGALNFQFQRVMTDQNVLEVDGEDAYLMRGSLPPGTVRLAWAYDLEVSGESLVIPVELPLRFFGLQVIAEALPELELSVEGMPAPRRLGQRGEECANSLETPNCAWVTQLRRGPSEAPLERIDLRVTGIPGPGPMRWIGVGAALGFVFLGILLAARLRPSGDASERREQRKALLLDQVRILEEEFAAGEVGPAFRQKRRDAIVRELAVLIHQDGLVGQTSAKGH